MKKNISLLLVLAVFISCVLGGCGNGSDSESGSTASADSTVSSAVSDAATSEDESQEASSGSTAGSGDYTITMAYIGNEQPNQEAVFAKVSEQMQQDIGMSFETIMLGFGDYQDKLNLMLSGGDKLDIFPAFYTLASSYINAGQVVNLSDYLEHLQDAIDFMGEDYALAGQINGYIYGLPSNKEGATLGGIVMRKDIVDELQIDVDAIKTFDDLTAVFEQVKAAHPEMDAIAGTNTINSIPEWDNMLDYFGVLMDRGQSTTVENLFETELYKSKVQRVNDWYKAGYIKLDAATTTETSSNLVKAGSLFSFLAPIKPGYLAQTNVDCNREMVTAYINKDDGSVSNIICTDNVNFFNWGIARQSEDKVKAMQFLNYAYSTGEWNNLMNFGIEGEDYALVEGSDIVIDYPEGADTANCYHLNLGWMMPNQFTGYIWNGYPEDVWQQYQDFNASATYSKAFGFIYDPSSLSTELTALQSVLNEYKRPLETGSVSDVEATLKEFNDKLYAAGLQKIMDLKQEQLDAWLAQQ